MPSDLVLDAPPAGTLASDASFWDVYESSFPSSEREPRGVILDTVRDGVGLANRARLREATVGIAFIHLLQDPPAGFLVYLAVAEEHRSRQIGARLFARARTSAESRYAEIGRTPIGLVWEVEVPELAPGAEELERRRRRIAFFERRGARLLPEHYLQPPVDGVAPVPMRLMFLPDRNRSFPDASVMSSLIRAIYFEKYLARNGIPRELLEELLLRGS